MTRKGSNKTEQAASVRMPMEFYDEWREAADRLDVSMNWVAKRAIRAWLDNGGVEKVLDAGSGRLAVDVSTLSDRGPITMYVPRSAEDLEDAEHQAAMDEEVLRKLTEPRASGGKVSRETSEPTKPTFEQRL